MVKNERLVAKKMQLNEIIAFRFFPLNLTGKFNRVQSPLNLHNTQHN